MRLRVRKARNAGSRCAELRREQVCSMRRRKSECAPRALARLLRCAARCCPYGECCYEKWKGIGGPDAGGFKQIESVAEAPLSPASRRDMSNASAPIPAATMKLREDGFPARSLKWMRPTGTRTGTDSRSFCATLAGDPIKPRLRPMRWRCRAESRPMRHRCRRGSAGRHAPCHHRRKQSRRRSPDELPFGPGLSRRSRSSKHKFRQRRRPRETLPARLERLLPVVQRTAPRTGYRSARHCAFRILSLPPTAEDSVRVASIISGRDAGQVAGERWRLAQRMSDAVRPGGSSAVGLKFMR